MDDTNLNPQTLPQNEPAETTLTDDPNNNQDPHANKPHDLRKQLEAEKKQRKAIEEELQKLKQAELDKQKSLEEKLVDAQKALEETNKRIKETESTFALKESLINSKVNPELLPLLLDHAKSKLEGEELETVLSELKTAYPSAFVKEDPKPAPLGRIGASITTPGETNALTKEQVAQLLLDPRTKITPELEKKANEYGL